MSHLLTSLHICARLFPLCHTGGTGSSFDPQHPPFKTLPGLRCPDFHLASPCCPPPAFPCSIQPFLAQAIKERTLAIPQRVPGTRPDLLRSPQHLEQLFDGYHRWGLGLAVPCVGLSTPGTGPAVPCMSSC